MRATFQLLAKHALMQKHKNRWRSVIFLSDVYTCTKGTSGGLYLYSLLFNKQDCNILI